MHVHAKKHGPNLIDTKEDESTTVPAEKKTDSTLSVTQMCRWRCAHLCLCVLVHLKPQTDERWFWVSCTHWLNTEHFHHSFKKGITVCPNVQKSWWVKLSIFCLKSKKKQEAYLKNLLEKKKCIWGVEHANTGLAPSDGSCPAKIYNGPGQIWSCCPLRTWPVPSSKTSTFCCSR